MSTSLSHSALQPAWKEEVNRRIEAHKSRKGLSVVDQGAQELQGTANNRAAAAAARVAARYANVPSFSEMQAAEARAAVRAAQAAVDAAREAHSAAQAVLDHFEAADPIAEVKIEARTVSTVKVQPESRTAHQTASQVEAAPAHRAEIRWEPDVPVQSAKQERPAPIRDPWNESAGVLDVYELGNIYEAIEAAQPIPANLIEFPREIIATRRMRPRIEDAAGTSDPQQLSIFEVDPNSVSIDPMAQAANPASDPTWIGSSWSEIELDEQPQPLPDYYAIPAADAPKLYQAPFSRRMMATLVDTALILAVVCGLAFLAASKLDSLPNMRASEICAVIVILGFAALYEWFFLTFAKVTPGMRYAQLSLCTFDEEAPTKEQVKGRLKAMLISVLPVGLGMIWSIFDEDQMSWHDRLSKTYLRLS